MTVPKDIIFLLSKSMSYHLVPLIRNFKARRQLSVSGSQLRFEMSSPEFCHCCFSSPSPSPFIRAMTNCATFVVRKEEERRKVKRSVNSDGWFFNRNYRCGTPGKKAVCLQGTWTPKMWIYVKILLLYKVWRHLENRVCSDCVYELRL